MLGIAGSKLRSPSSSAPHLAGCRATAAAWSPGNASGPAQRSQPCAARRGRPLRRRRPANAGIFPVPSAQRLPTHLAPDTHLLCTSCLHSSTKELLVAWSGNTCTVAQRSAGNGRRQRAPGQFGAPHQAHAVIAPPLGSACHRPPRNTGAPHQAHFVIAPPLGSACHRPRNTSQTRCVAPPVGHSPCSTGRRDRRARGRAAAAGHRAECRS